MLRRLSNYEQEAATSLNRSNSQQASVVLSPRRQPFPNLSPDVDWFAWRMTSLNRMILLLGCHFISRFIPFHNYHSLPGSWGFPWNIDCRLGFVYVNALRGTRWLSIIFVLICSHNWITGTALERLKLAKRGISMTVVWLSSRLVTRVNLEEGKQKRLEHKNIR